VSRTVIEMDQWSQTGDIDKWTFEEWVGLIGNLKDGHAPKLEGGDAQAGQAIFGGDYAVKEVDEDDRPRLGLVWFIEGSGGELERWKANFATR